MNILKKVAMIILMQNDLNAAVEFYKKLGLKLVFSVPEKWAEMKLGDIQIGLCPIPEKLGEYRTGIVFEVADVKALYEEFKNSMTFINEPIVAAHGIMISLKDPSGNIFDLYQPTPELLEKVIAQAKQQEGCCKGPEATACCKDEEKSSSACC